RKENNGIDDDGNGFVDDIHGWNFTDGTNDVMDEHGHGTHVAGIIGAKQRGLSGSIGVSPDVSLMILKYYDPTQNGRNNLINTIRAMKYAIRMGADIINYSGGGSLRSTDEEKVLLEAAEKNVLVVAAAGNEGENSDYHHYYPANYGLPNILSVTALDQRDRLL